MTRSDVSASLAERVESLLSPGGKLARRWPAYEQRAAQIDLAIDVARVIEDGGVLMAEAPTGIGKSLAYLLPCVLAAVEGRERMVVATCTRALQDQLFEHDLPALLEAIEVRLPCARLKGKQNYLCPRALAGLADVEPGDREVVAELASWSASDPECDLDRFAASDPVRFQALRGRLGADPTACSGAGCRGPRECPWVRARRRAADSRLLIVNHALLALSASADGLLPDLDVLIVDEAHRLEGALLSQLELSVSRSRFDEALRLYGRARARGEGARGGLLARVRGYLAPLLDGDAPQSAEVRVTDLTRRIARATDDVEAFFERLRPDRSAAGPYERRDRYRRVEELLGRDLEPLEALHGHCSAVSRGPVELSLALDPIGPGAAELAAELEHAAATWSALGHDLEKLSDASERDWVYWRSSTRRGTELHGSPITAGDHARRMVLSRARSVVLSSATLSATGSFAFTAERRGLGTEAGLPYAGQSYPSPFPLERQMLSLVLDGEAAEEADVVSGVILALHRSTSANLLALFTAHERLRRAREKLREPLGDALLAQEWDGSAGQVSARFRERRGAVLLGVQSLWEGVDLPGESLEILVVAKLPFSVPEDPLVRARAERLVERGREPFREDALPEAVLRFRQGVGRLIRRADDRGVLVVCDPRLARASYRGAFRSALPTEPQTVRDLADLAGRASAFLARDARPNPNLREEEQR